MDERERALAGVLAAHRTLAARLEGLTDEQTRQPSLLPGWTVGHVLTHIARNADGLRNMLEGAMRGETAAMYPGGLEQRGTDIEAGATRPAAHLVADVVAANERLEAAFAAMTDDAWAGSGIAAFGPVAMRDVPTRRRTEVEAHLADAGLGYSWRDWPTEFVRVEIQRLTMLWNSRQPMGLTGLPPAALAVDEHQRAAWLLGRADIDGLEPARLMG
jgi:maleylpyruvate isomerase